MMLFRWRRPTEKVIASKTMPQGDRIILHLKFHMGKPLSAAAKREDSQVENLQGKTDVDEGQANS
jgi:hypothetical protein